MKYGITFLLLGAALILQGMLRQGGHWFLLWPGVSFTAVGLGYVRLGAAVFGKRPDGTLPWYTVVVLLPYFVLSWTIWHIVRLTSGEPCWHEACPGVFVGRRALPRELPNGVGLIVDLTAEFSEPRKVREGRDYICFPVLDASATSEEAAAQTVMQIASHPGAVYIHCAQGHGRTGMFAAAVLVAKGLAVDTDDAVARLRAVRPGIAMNRRQLEFCRRVCERVQPEPLRDAGCDSPYAAVTSGATSSGATGSS
jgi:protein-tyrosine phosphatase